MVKKVSVLFMIFSYLLPYTGIIKVPVADLVGHALSPNKIFTYQTLPYSCYKSRFEGCPRITQALFNESVEVVEATESEVKIKIRNLFYQSHLSSEKIATFWTKKENVLALSKIPENMHYAIPNPIDYQNFRQHEEVITLLAPWHNESNTSIFSAGTRFVVKEESQDHYIIHFFDPEKEKIKVENLPKKLALKQPKTEKESHQYFVAILKHWASQKEIIPYVWGGCSLVSFGGKDSYAIATHNTVPFYERPLFQKKGTKYGFDCAGMIGRAAQICGIPFFFKNTYTISQNLDTIINADEIQNGDIIYFPGHVMAVSDVKKGLCIEARSYDHGYGKIHEASLPNLFKGIHSFKELMAALSTRKTIERLNANQEVIQNITGMKILKLSSAYDKVHKVKN